jgi:hypothetical protein
MTVTGYALAGLKRLLAAGEVPAVHVAALPAGRDRGLWAPSIDGKRQVVTGSIVRLWSVLAGDGTETTAAVCACEPGIRPAWNCILAARLKEMGDRRDAAELYRAVDLLGAASVAVRGQLATASLKPTGFGELESELFGAPAEQAVALPKLLRVIAATANLVEGGQGAAAESLPDVLPLDPRHNWVRGRVLRSPDRAEPQPESPSAVLSGGWADLMEDEFSLGREPGRRHELMRWVLLRPWAFLMAQVIFAQASWAKEPTQGGLALELDEDQLQRFHEPGLVRVVVTTAEGDEVLCGSLGELVHRVLTQLGVVLLAPTQSPAFLDDRLGALVHALLERRVWRYDVRAAVGQRPGYVIHDEFDTASEGRFGRHPFAWLGSAVTEAVRTASEAWARERLSRARTAQPVGAGSH